MSRGLLVLALAALLAVTASPGARAQTDDHFALLMVWMPGLCKLEGDRPECKDLSLRRYDGRNLAFMALEVTHDSGSAATFCYTMPSAQEMDSSRRWCDMDPARVTDDDTAAALKELMPVMQSCQDRGLWAKYGSCTMYSANDYYGRGIRLAQQLAASQMNLKIGGATGTTASQQSLVEAFKADFGEDSGGAVDFICRKAGGKFHLLYVKISVTVRALTRGLAPELLWNPKGAVRRSCPETIEVDAPPVPVASSVGAAAGSGEAGAPTPVPAAVPAPPGEPPPPESAPVAPVETAPLGPKTIGPAGK